MECSVALPPDNPVPTEETDPPDGGTDWQARGNFGSTLWDPLETLGSGTSQSLHVVICDPCLLERRDRVLVVSTRRNIARSNWPWNPKGDEDAMT
jgi:hypothetical protein